MTTPPRPADTAPPRETHAIPWDAPGGLRPWMLRRAWCGRLMQNREATTAPTCPACRAAIAAYEALNI